MEVKRTLPQSAKLHAICGEVAKQCPLIPYRRTFACEAWKRFFVSQFIRETRLEAYCDGRPDPFPVRPVPTSSLDSTQMSELIEWAQSWCVQNGISLTK